MKTILIISLWVAAIVGVIVLGVLTDYFKLRTILLLFGR